MLVGSERSFLIDGCESGIRGDGRGCLDWRPVSIDTSVVPSASGSARVQIRATDVVVGIKVSHGCTDVPRCAEHCTMPWSVLPMPP